MTTTRLNHTICDHASTAAARKLCRAGDAKLRGLARFDVLRVDGVAYSIEYISTGFGSPVEARFSFWTLATGWTSQGFMQADFFATATIERDPRNV
jgi:hypothetical protein